MAIGLAARGRHAPSLAGRRVLITGAARGIGAALAERLDQRGAQVALLGLEPDLLAATARRTATTRPSGAPWRECDVSDEAAVEAAVSELVGELGGLDVVVANAGIARQLPIIGGQRGVFEAQLRVNTLGVFYTLRAAGPHIAHANGYAVAVASLAAAVHLPLMGAYSASKAAVEALGNTVRQELQHSGARVGVAYFAELDTDMTARGFGTEAARALVGNRAVTGIAPVTVAIDALERGIARRSRRICAPAWVAPMLPLRPVAQRAIEAKGFRDLRRTLELAQIEEVDFTTDQPPQR